MSLKTCEPDFQPLKLQWHRFERLAYVDELSRLSREEKLPSSSTLTVALPTLSIVIENQKSNFAAYTIHDER